jgi:hypothetical protein
MKRYSILMFAFLIGVFSVSSGCNYFQSAKFSEKSKLPEKTEEIFTKITKDVLKERLGKKGIETIPIRSADKILKPNPLTLNVKFVNGGVSPKLKLNNEEYEFDELVKKLYAIFKERENYGVFREGTNEIEKEISLGASDGEIAYYDSNRIYVEDFEKLVDNLRKAGIDQIKLDVVDFASVKIPDNINPNSKIISNMKKPTSKDEEDAPPPTRSSTSNSAKQNQ